MSGSKTVFVFPDHPQKIGLALAGDQTAFAGKAEKCRKALFCNIRIIPPKIKNRFNGGKDTPQVNIRLAHSSC